MQHPDEGTIHSWLDGALSADEAARVEAHVKDCPECAAAVAEARGFIAASSRILTALDNAPRGVIPAKATRKRVDPIVWRVAATLLVVAGGTFVVLRNGGRGAPTVSNDNVGVAGAATAVAPQTPDSTESSASSESPAVAKAAGTPSTIMGNPTRVAGGSSQTNTFSGRKPTARAEAADRLTAKQNAPAAAAPPLAYSTTAPAARPQAASPMVLNGNVAGGSRSTAEVGTPIRGALEPAPAGSVAALDAAREPQALKIVSTATQIGAKTTLYEVAPGDTVTLTEIVSAQLLSARAAGMSSARTADQSPEKSAAAPAAKSAVGSVQAANGVTTISWTDPVTRNVMKLSGRMSEAQLQQIRIRIERERAAQEAKKKP